MYWGNLIVATWNLLEALSADVDKCVGRERTCPSFITYAHVRQELEDRDVCVCCSGEISQRKV